MPSDDKLEGEIPANEPDDGMMTASLEQLTCPGVILTLAHAINVYIAI